MVWWLVGWLINPPPPKKKETHTTKDDTQTRKQARTSSPLAEAGRLLSSSSISLSFRSPTRYIRPPLYLGGCYYRIV